MSCTENEGVNVSVNGKGNAPYTGPYTGPYTVLIPEWADYKVVWLENCELIRVLQNKEIEVEQRLSNSPLHFSLRELGN